MSARPARSPMTRWSEHDRRAVPGRTSAVGRLLAGLLALFTVSAYSGPLPVWTIRGQGQEMVIVGSIHFLRAGQDRLPQAIIDAYQRADVLVMEIDLDDLDDASSQATMLRLGRDPQGRTLQALLGDKAYGEAAGKARALGMDLAPLQGFEPWLAALVVSQMRLAELGFDARSGVEQQLLVLAGRDGKEVRGLESLDEQLGAMDGLPAEEQRAFLLQTLEDAATMADEAERIVAAWQKGDARALQDQFLHGIREQPELYRRVVVDRNRKWASQLQALLADEHHYLVIVGTLHLVGPDSLIAMLAASGYEAQQMQTEPALPQARSAQ